MNKADLLQLVEKYLEGKATAAEHAVLVDYYEAFESEPDALAELGEAARQALKDEIQYAVWKRINDAEEPGDCRRNQC